ncbi:conjugal transfer protein TraG, partial [Campylobacter coli]|nr:conjugal transfer protein TraG [Campylobacter coli]
ELAKVDDQRFRDFADQLRPFCKEGIYGKYFNGPCEFNIEKEFIVTEFKGLEGHNDLRDPLIMLLIYHINQLMYMSSDRKSRIQIIIDEAHRFLGKNPKMDDFIEQAYRRARKYDASVIIATQGFDDIYNAKDGGLSRAGTVIINNSAYKVFMKQTETSVNMLIKSEVFSLSETDKEILRSIMTLKGEYSELFLMTPDDVKLPYRLVMDKYFYYLTTTDPKDKA